MFFRFVLACLASLSFQLCAAGAESDCTGAGASLNRCRQAQMLLTEMNEFEAQAAAYHVQVAGLEKDSAVLIAQAKEISSTSRKLKGKLQSVTTIRSLDATAYKTHLDEFKSHVKLYELHLKEYEKQIAAAQQAGVKLQSTCSQYADHAYRYHVPGVRPPHICVQLQQTERDMQGHVRRFVADQARAQKSESELARQESALQAAQDERSKLEAKLLRKASVATIEQSEGRMVLAEFQALAREFKNLDAERKRLGVK